MSTAFCWLGAMAWPVAMLGWGEMLVIGLVALLVFGKRLPEVARSLGKGVVEFKKGLRGIENEVDDAVAAPNARRPSAPKELPNAVVDKPPIEPAKVSEKAPAVGGEAEG